MSEDSFRIEFSSENMRKLSTRKIFEEVYRKYVPEEVITNSESSINYEGDSAVYYAGFFDIDPSNVDRILQDLENVGAKDAIASVWHDTSGEDMIFARMNGELLNFESKGALIAYKAEQRKNILGLAISYGKDNNSNIMLVRLNIKVKTKRNKICSLFEGAKNMVSEEQHSSFVEEFKSLVRSKTHDITWCKFKWKDGEKWHEVANKDFIYALVDVIEDDEYVYLAFDIDKLEGEFQLDDFVYFVLYSLDGVKKIWIKYWPGNDNKIGFYLYYPGMGDESFFMERELPDDNQWLK